MNGKGMVLRKKMKSEKVNFGKRKVLTLSVLFAALIFAIVSIGCASADLNEGLVAHYPFNGNANDDSGNGNDGTVYGATLTADRFGNQDSAYEFDGDDYINCGNDESLAISSSITVAAWIKIDRFNYGGIVCKQSTIDGDYFLTIGCGGSAYYNNIRFGNKGLGTHLGGIDCGPASNPLELGKWYYVAGVFDDDSNKIYVYINGIFHNSEDFTGSIPTSTGDLTIGTYCGTTKYLFDGTIDDVRIYNRALSETEIKELYNPYDDGDVPTPKKGLVGYWNFDEGSGNTAHDSSGNGNDGTIQGATRVDNGNCKKALSFDGNEDSVQIPHTVINNLLDITFSA
jgi:hypothetical protein